MRLCPHCSAPTLRSLSLLRATRQRPLRCKACGALALLPWWASLPGVAIFELCVWIGVGAALVHGQPLIFMASLLLPAALAWLGAALVPIQCRLPSRNTLSFYSGEP